MPAPLYFLLLFMMLPDNYDLMKNVRLRQEIITSKPVGYILQKLFLARVCPNFVQKRTAWLFFSIY
ncbi:hypothetical protein GZ78_22820 [Endozoicomonas numazuensis]|uniref:Uncharacterized protein n=1 Tax=Endozoicomonas numazuensis TaxID=1137799 RepID=A0A081NDX8_9GAMM|nr:hypothetical protein GZ78_22820 [Endozoicomonas numazuensis]